MNKFPVPLANPFTPFMKFESYAPSPPLAPYIKQYVVSESENAGAYKVFPSTGLVIGFQYRGRLSVMKDEHEYALSTAGVTGLTDGYKQFRNTDEIGTVLVYFTEVGFARFATNPVHELFNLSLSLEDLFDKQTVRDVEERLREAKSDRQRISIVDRFLTAQWKDIESDRLVVEAVKRIYQSGGSIRIKELSEQLFISQSPFEKRFRKVVGTSPKKFASIVRFNAVVDNLTTSKTLTEICYEHHFFDQAHFIKDFKRFTGETPEEFQRPV